MNQQLEVRRQQLEMSPKELKQLQAIRQQIGEPVLVPVAVPHNAVPSYCTFNVKEVSAAIGGSRQYGWAFQLGVGAGDGLIVAVNHCVLAKEQTLIDVTPTNNGSDGYMEVQLGDGVYRWFVIDDQAVPLWDRYHNPNRVVIVDKAAKKLANKFRQYEWQRWQEGRKRAQHHWERCQPLTN